jgi:small-conductance mechanosensitive channel
MIYIRVWLMSLPSFLYTQVIRGNTFYNLSIALLVFASLRTIFGVLKYYVFQWIEAIIERYKSRKAIYSAVTSILHTPQLVFILISLYLALLTVYIPNYIQKWIDIVFIGIMFVRAASIVTKFGSVLISRAISHHHEEDLETTKNMIQLVVSIIVWSLALLLFLINIGVEVSPLIASLWIWGIAIAFALKSVLEDVFASFSILFDRPFRVGDLIVIGEHMGTVKCVSFKSTHIVALGGQCIVIPNKQIVDSIVHNYTLMQKRRHKQTIGVVYETPSDVLERIPGILEEEITKIDNVVFNRAHIKEFADFSIIIEFAYTIQDRDYNLFMDTNQTILLAIFRRFANESIQIAYPTQLVYTKPLGTSSS